MELTPVKGMRDFLPAEMAIRNWLFSHFHAAARLFHFLEYDTCVVESEELFVRKEGEEITDQLYGFTDKGNRRLALRPEITPSLARLIRSEEGRLSPPVRWYTVGQCFRYERMQRGRKREHYQWNMDIIGEASLFAEVEVIAAVVEFFRRVGLSEKDVVIRYNNRQLLAQHLDKCGIPRDRHGEVSVVLDKLEKIGPAAVRDLLSETGLSGDTIDTALEFTAARTLEEVRRLVPDSSVARADVEELGRLARVYGIEGFLEFSPSLVRGLSYYTGTVFEGFERTGTGRAIFGGGRYDRLIETYGGTPTPMVGFGFGDVVILNILQEKNLVPQTLGGPDALVIAYSEAEVTHSIQTAQELRNAGVSAELDLTFKRLGKSLARADTMGFTHAIIVAPDELQNNQVTVKDLNRGSDHRVDLGNVAAAISKAL